MKERHTGPGLFFGAIGDVLRHRGMAIQIVALPLLLLILVEAVSAQAFVQWWNSDLLHNPPPEILRTLGFYVVIGVVAVAWHRLMILREYPESAIPAMRPMIWFKYLVGWLVIGIVLGLATILLIVLPVFVLGSLLDPFFGSMVAEFFAPGGLAPSNLPTTLSIALAVLLVVLSLYFYLYAIFRVSMGLPAVAVDAETAPGMRASWRRTRPLSGAIMILTVLALLGQAGVFAVQFWIVSVVPQGDLTFAFEFGRRAMIALVDAINILVGAAILTRLYRATLDDGAADQMVG